MYTDLNREKIRSMLPLRDERCDKTGFGRLLCICGCTKMPGAAVLAVSGALRAGAGLVTVASAESVCNNVLNAAPECVLCPLPVDSDGYIASQASDVICSKEYLSRFSAVLFGCGMGISPGGHKTLQYLLANYSGKLIIDADGLNMLCNDIGLLQGSDGDIILTPHERELARLLKAARCNNARELSDKYGVAVVAKSAETAVYGKGQAFKAGAPNSALAKGGSGDVLAGIIASLAAQNCSGLDAAVCGVYLHAKAGQLAREKLSAYSALPRDTVSYLGEAFKYLLEK